MSHQGKCNSYGPDNVTYVSSTKLELDTFSFLWSIQNVSALALDDEISSPDYLGGPKTKHVWRLFGGAYQKPGDEDEITYFQLNLQLRKSGDKDQNTLLRPVKASFTFSVLDSNDKPVLQKGDPSDYSDFELRSNWGWDDFVVIKNRSVPQKLYMVNDTIKFHCQIWIQCRPTKIVKSICGFMQPEKADVVHQEQLRRDFEKGFSGSVLSDMSVVTASKTFQAHKFVLSTRSRVFQTMLTTSMLESTQNSVKIPDFDEDIVHGMLEYMYTGQTLISSNNNSDLLRIADKYELMGLKELCEFSLGTNLKIENACEVLVLAHLHNAKQLKANAMVFINLNRKEIISTEGFKELGKVDPLLFQELYMSQ